MRNNSRIKRIEKVLLPKKDDALWVVVPIGYLYGDENAQPYWTQDTPNLTLQDFYEGRTYKEVEHPTGKKAKVKYEHKE